MPKTIFRCSACDATAPRWAGQCAGCGEWNTLTEEAVIQTGTKSGGLQKSASAKPVESAIALSAKKTARLTTEIGELDRVLGGGIVPGSFVLLGGEPGIGKSTLTLQLAAKFAEKYGQVLLVSGEESAEQVALRATRTATDVNRLAILGENNLETILATATAEKPELLIVDSVQVMTSLASNSMAGSIPQIRVVAEGLLHFAKRTGTPVVLIGHVTKDGEIAGPQVLAHLVDVVLQFEGESTRDFRILRANKNRFGATSEVGIFEMQEKGLIEVVNPSEAFLAGRAENPLGSCITATLEGTRPLLVEVQALTASSSFGYPKRTASGFDLNRLNLLIAVLSRHAKIKLDSSDVFVNVVGGMRLREPAADLAVCLAIASSKLQKPLPADLIAFGEVGLSGEIRSVSQSEKRKIEAEKLGFEQVIDFKTAKNIGQLISQIF